MSGEGANRILPQFKEMKKSSMGESYLYLNKLLKGKSDKDFDNLDELLSDEITLPLFEESLKLIVIDSLKMEKEVIKILLSQNEYYIKRILKCRWFFEKPRPADFWITQIFPFVSFCTRINITNNLAKYWKCGSEAEKVVKHLSDEYGGVFAEKLLPKCGKDFIQAFVKRNKTPFYYNTSSKTLLNVAKRFPDIGIDILKFMCESDLYYDIYNYKKVIVHIASHQPELFIPFYEKYYSKLIYLNFGENLTRHIAHKIKEAYFSNCELAKYSLLKRKTFFKAVEFEDGIKFVEAYFKSDKENLTYDSWGRGQYLVSDALETMTPKTRLYFVETVFKKLFNSDFKDHPSLWTPNILELFPTEDRLYFVEKLEKLMTEAQEKDTNEVYNFSFEQPETLFYLYDFDVGFEKLKKIMSKAPTITRREIIVNYMVKNCALNKTSERIEQLVDYVTERHRQDDPSILTEFQEKFLEYFRNFPLKSKIMEKMEEVAYLWTLKGVFYEYRKIAEKLIISRLNEKLEVGKYMKKFFKFSLVDGCSYVFLFDFKSIHCKNLMYAYCEDIVEWIRANPDNENKKEEMLGNILETCKEYNKHHPNSPISVLEIPKLQKYLRELIIKLKGNLGGEEWPLEIFDKYYKEAFYFGCNTKFPVYILKKHPDVFLKIVDRILDNYSEFYYFNGFFVQCKKFFSFYDLTEKMKEKFINKLKEKEEIRKRLLSLEFYSHLATVEEFSQVFAEYVPKEEKISDEMEPEFAEIQLKIPEVIKNIRPRWKSLNLVLKFFFGDYLRGAVPSYYACCYSTRVDDIVPFLKNHFNNLPMKITLKKNLIRLISKLARRQEKIEFFLKCWNENPHYSIRTQLFSYITKSFIDQPTKEEFEVVKKFAMECDEMAISVRPELKRIPNDYLNEYVSALWAFSEKQPAKSKNSFRSSILMHLDKNNIPFLSKEFCEKLIRDNLFNNLSLNVTNFTIFYVISNLNELNERTCLILELLKNSASKTDAISDFVKNFLRISFKDIKVFEIINVFLRNWPESLNTKLYSDHLALRYCELLYYAFKKFPNFEENKNQVAAEFGKQIKELYLSFDNLNDLMVILIDSLTQNLKELTGDELKLDALYVLKEFFTAPINKSLIIIGLSVLPDDVVRLFCSKDSIFGVKEKERKKIINEIVESLVNYNDDIVNVYLYKKFKNLELPVEIKK